MCVCVYTRLRAYHYAAIDHVYRDVETLRTELTGSPFRGCRGRKYGLNVFFFLSATNDRNPSVRTHRRLYDPFNHVTIYTSTANRLCFTKREISESVRNEKYFSFKIQIITVKIAHSPKTQFAELSFYLDKHGSLILSLNVCLVCCK